MDVLKKVMGNKRAWASLAMTAFVVGGLSAGQQLQANQQQAAKVTEVYVSEEFNSAKGGVVLFSEDVTVPSTVSADFINKRLAGTNMAGLGQAFKNAEKKYGVNAIFLTGLAIHESDYGRSQIARAKNNLFGFMAYDATPFSSAGYFESFEAGIDYVARYLSQHYLTPGGQFYNGKSMAAINKRYATDQSWHVKIVTRVRTFLKQ